MNFPVLDNPLLPKIDLGSFIDGVEYAADTIQANTAYSLGLKVARASIEQQYL